MLNSRQGSYLKGVPSFILWDITDRELGHDHIGDPCIEPSIPL